MFGSSSSDSNSSSSSSSSDSTSSGSSGNSSSSSSSYSATFHYKVGGNSNYALNHTDCYPCYWYGTDDSTDEVCAYNFYMHDNENVDMYLAYALNMNDIYNFHMGCGYIDEYWEDDPFWVTDATDWQPDTTYKCNLGDGKTLTIKTGSTLTSDITVTIN